jgi:protein required for attachment to host cells
MMKNHKIEKGTWIALCDGARSLILSNVGDEKFFNFRKVDAAEGNRRPNSELGRDRPPRAQESSSARRSAIEVVDKHEQYEQEFLRGFAEKLNAGVAAGLTNKIVLAAPPRALGYIRNVLPAAVADAVSLEVERDLVKLPLPEIEAALKAAISLR